MVKKNSIWYDAIILIIAFALIFVTLNYFKVNLSFDMKSLIELLIGLFGTLLGFVITAFTILFMFDTDKNPTLIKIKKAGLFPQINERFITTIIINFISLVFVLVYFILLSFISNFYILNIITFYLLALTLVRIYRSLNILYLIYKVL
jgi:hypothetical protein